MILADRQENVGAPRKPRADAERNRIRLIEAARAVFMGQGPDVALDEIARHAGVGIGTLYRHFPTRDLLLTEVYRHGVEQLAGAAAGLSNVGTPVDALREWLRLFVDYIATKQVIAPALGSMADGTSDLYASTAKTIKSAISLLIDGAAANGDIRLDLDPLDLLRALASVAYVDDRPDWQARAYMLVDILIEGVRVRKSAST